MVQHARQGESNTVMITSARSVARFCGRRSLLAGFESTRNMSQQQPRRPLQGSDEGQGREQGAPIKFGDVLPVTGKLADQPVAPRDAAMMQSAESTVLGEIPKGGPAAAMESAAMRNEQRGYVGHGQISGITAQEGVSVTETDIPGQPGKRLVTEFVAGQPVGQYVVDAGVRGGQGGGGGGDIGDLPGVDIGTASTWTQKITMGEALQAAAATAGDKPVEASDAAAIQAAESAAAGINVKGGLAAAAQSAAAANAGREGDKAKLGDVLEDASLRLPDDKDVTREDAERVMRAEMHNNPDMQTHPGGVATNVVAAARLNERR